MPTAKPASRRAPKPVQEPASQGQGDAFAEFLSAAEKPEPQSKPLASFQVKCLGWKKRPWNMDVHDTYVVFTNPNGSIRRRFPDEIKRHGFAHAIISGYNFWFVASSKRHRFRLDKKALSYIRSLAAASVPPETRRRLIRNVRVLSAIHLFLIVLSFVLWGVVVVG